MTDDLVLATIIRNVRLVLPDIEPGQVAPERSLTELGCNSIDRAEVVSLSMEDLDVVVPVAEFAGVHNVATLAALLRRHLP